MVRISHDANRLGPAREVAAEARVDAQPVMAGPASPLEASAAARKLGQDSRPGHDTVGTGHGMRLAGLRAGTDGLAAASARLKALETLLRAGASAAEVGARVTDMSWPGDAEAAFLWSPAGDAIRGRLNEVVAALARLHPDAIIEGRLLDHERTLGPAEQAQIIQSRTVPLAFSAASMQVAEALCSGDKAGASRIAQQTLQRFAGQELGLMPYLRKVAAGEV